MPGARAALDPFPFDPLADVGPLPLYETVREAWSAPGRRYHDLAHLGEMLGHLARAERAVGFAAPAEVFLAALFHDAVYEPLASDNEARSAALAIDCIAREPLLGHVDRDRVAALILATADHQRASVEGPAGSDLALFLDADTAILGAPPARYDAYAAAVRAEYAAVPDESFRRGRARFLRGVVAAPAIFKSPFFRAELEASARANVARELASLEP